MINRLINEIRKCMDCDCLLAGLALALTLPDICGKAEFPQENSSKKRYIQWYDEIVGITEKPPKSAQSDTELPYLSGEVVYSLRCQLLHQGTPNIETKKIKEEACQIDDFTLLIEKKKNPEIYTDSAAVFSGGTDSLGKYPAFRIRSYEVNVRRLCFVLCACAKAYYQKSPEKFDFFNYEIVDLDERKEQFFKARPDAQDIDLAEMLRLMDAGLNSENQE